MTAAAQDDAAILAARIDAALDCNEHLWWLPFLPHEAQAAVRAILHQLVLGERESGDEAAIREIVEIVTGSSGDQPVHPGDPRSPHAPRAS